ncbi:MAG: non-specific endonuclease [Phenylobacterium sp.]|nr:non-specific endonuclease [Phenylobacterium sp.]
MRVLALAACMGVAMLAAPSAAQPSAPAATPPAPQQDSAVLKQCLAHFAVAGLPRHRSENGLAEQVRPAICRRGYALSFNKRTRNPDWVVERLEPNELKGLAVRRDNFTPDPYLGVFSPRDADYAKTGFDRGHQAPAADSKYDQAVMDESFYMSNMSPQVGLGFNRGQWKYLEESMRAAVVCGGKTDVLVITGPIYGATSRTIGNPPITVPEAYYKIAYDVRSGRAVGYKLFNKKYVKTDLRDLVVPITQIEDETGLDFFPALSRRKQTQIERAKGEVWGHGEQCDNIQE